jgi:hypothetical protein
MTIASRASPQALEQPLVAPHSPQRIEPNLTHECSSYAATERLRTPEQMLCAVGLSNGYCFDIPIRRSGRLDIESSVWPGTCGGIADRA